MSFSDVTRTDVRTVLAVFACSIVAGGIYGFFAGGTFVYMIVIVFSLAIADNLFHREPMAVMLRKETFWAGWAAGLVAGFFINFSLLVQRMLGRSTLIDFVTGRYHRPREEMRIFLFLDLEGSTAIAERLGGRRYLEFLNHFFFDITKAVLQTRGDIHKYIGDAVIITWRLTEGLRDASCLRCFFAILTEIEKGGREYEREFGAVPRIRGALHCGMIVAGEIGDLKQEIAFVGDPMNAASRMERICKERNRSLVLSGETLWRLTVPREFEVEPLGRLTLRGSEQELELFAVSRVGRALTAR